jgi:hypothetical protein
MAAYRPNRAEQTSRARPRDMDNRARQERRGRRPPAQTPRISATQAADLPGPLAILAYPVPLRTPRSSEQAVAAAPALQCRQVQAERRDQAPVQAVRVHQAISMAAAQDHRTANKEHLRQTGQAVQADLRVQLRARAAHPGLRPGKEPHPKQVRLAAVLVDRRMGQNPWAVRPLPISAPEIRTPCPAALPVGAAILREARTRPPSLVCRPRLRASRRLRCRFPYPPQTRLAVP